MENTNPTIQLQTGNYMRASTVDEFILNHFKFTLADVVKETCKIHKDEFGEYYSTQDLSNVIAPHLFKEMECEVITYVIL